LVLDLDVHQGDGTAQIFADRPEVTTVSMHCDKNYPSRKAQSDVDLEVPVGTGDGAYLALLEQVLSALPLRGARPDIVFYVAGVDPHGDDQLGKLNLTDAGLFARDQRIVAFADALGVPLVGVLGGGYGPSVEVLAHRHALLHRAMAGWSAPAP
jgi:acetoin utilization deacetylase AcuC-like enzyme